MRLVVYNIRYATGTGPAFHLPLPGAGYLRTSRRVLTGITEFLRTERPDVVGLIEVDTGSIRSGMVNQAEYIANENVDWDGRALVDAIKRQARHEETNRWEVIEFKLD